MDLINSTSVELSSISNSLVESISITHAVSYTIILFISFLAVPVISIGGMLLIFIAAADKTT